MDKSFWRRGGRNLQDFVVHRAVEARETTN